MKKILFFLVAVMMIISVSAQTIVFQENFESPTVGLTTTADSGGFPTTSFQAWAASTNLFKSGLKADTNVLQLGKTIYFTSNSFATTGNNYVILEFAQICKLYFADGGIIEVSVDGGLVWLPLGLSEYLGTGNLIASGNISRFSDNAYIDWLSGTNTIPTNAWWKNEKFDISAIAANQANVKIRFKFTSSGQPSGAGRYGWLLDDIKVTASPSELNPPKITMIAYPKDTVYYGGPYQVSAFVKDVSGIDTVFILYKVGNGAFTQLGMVKSPIIDSLYTGSIPYVGYGRTVTYNITASDASTAHNLAYSPNTGYYSFFTKYSPGGNVTVGAGTAVQNYPFKTNADFAKSAALYVASTINRFGLINQLQWNVSTAQPTITVPIKIYIKQTSLTAMTADSWDNLKAGAILVYDGPQSFITTGLKTIILTTPFNYNSGNLMVLCEANYGLPAALVSPSFTYTSGTTGSHQFFASSASATGTVNTQRPNIVIGFVVYPLPSQDAGVSQIVNPSGSVIAGTTFDVNVRIKNFGNALLTKANVFYTVDGSAPISTAWTGSLQTDSTVLYTAASLNLSVGIHALKVWTNLPNDSVDQNFLNDTAYFSFYACAGPLSGTYTVGGVGANFPTFGDVYTGLSQCGISGPVVFNIAAATYSDQLTIPEIVGSSAINTITFKSATNDSTAVIMNHTSIAAANWIFRLNGADNIIFKNIKFAPADSLYSTAIVMTNGATNNKLIGNLFVGYGGLAVSQTLINVDGTVLANAGNLIQGNYLIKGSYGISIKGTAAVKLKNTVVKNNTLENNAVYGIYAQYVDSTLIDSNTVNSSVVNTASKYGIYLQNGNVLNKITKNTVILTGGTNMFGILAETCVSTDTTKGLIANNFVSILNGSNFAYGIRLNTVTKFKVYANSVVTNGNNATDTRAINIVSSSVANELKNNNSLSNKYPIFIEGTTSVSSSDYNNYYSTGTTFASYNSISYANLAAYKTASLKDSNSISVNPYFLSLTNLHTFNGLLKGMGISLSDVTIDIDGAPRLSPPCIGADEFLPPANDASLISFIKPSGSCGLTTAEDVEVVIKNVGSGTMISGSYTSTYKIGGNAIVPETINRTIASGDTIHYIYNAKANLSVAITHLDSTFQFIAWTDLTGDFAHANDSSSISVTSSYLPPSPVVSNVTIPYATTATITVVSTDTVYWYANQNDAVKIASGLSFTTPVLTDTTTYWVAAVNSAGGASAYVGAVAPLSTAGTGGGINTYLTFTAISNCIVQAVDIFPYGTGPGTVTIALQTSAGVAITSTTVNCTGATSPLSPAQTAVLNFPVTAGTSYRLVATAWTGGVTNLYRDLTATFPYTLPGILSITGASLSPYYYFFYNWKVGSSLIGGTGCQSARVPVTVYTVVSPREAGISAIVAPTGCALYQVPISVKIFNHGSDILNSTNTTATYKLDNGSYITPEPINITINPFDTATFTFSTLANFTAPTVDRYIKVTTIVIAPGDAFHNNDTLVKDSILSRFTPPSPTANNVNVFYGDHATLTATATNGNVVWFDQPVGGNSIGQGSPFTTSFPIYQYPADTFYVEANTSFSATATFGTGTILNGTTGYPSPYGNFYTGVKEQFLILASELQALGIQAGNLSSVAFDVVTPSLATTSGTAPSGSHMKNFTVGVGFTSINALTTSFVTGITQVYSTPHYIDVVGWNIHTFTTPVVWDGISNVVIQTCFDNYVTASDYSSAHAVLNQTATSFVSALDYHSDGGGVCPSLTTGTNYSQRPNMQINGMVPGCSSTPRVPVIVTVSPPPQNDAGVTALINPVGSTPSGISTPIKVKIKNYGQANLTSVAVTWTLNGVAQTVYNFTGNLPTGSDSTITIANLTFSGGLYCVKAWTEHPNAAAIDSVASNDTLGTTCFTACLNGTYTIGTTSTANTNFLTFNAAASTLKVAGVCGSVTFLVDTGTYNEQVRISEIAGASAINTITFRSVSNDSSSVIIEFASSLSTANYTLLLDSADYIRIERMTIKATGASYGRVIELRNGATYNIISNNRLEMPVTTSSNYAGIYDYNTPNFYNKYQNNTILNGYYGIYTYGASTTVLKKKTEIIGNRVLQSYYYGIYSYYQDSIKIIGNEINSSAAVYGLYSGYNQNAIQILKNKVILTGAGTHYGLYVYYCTGTASAHGLIANNMIALSGGTTTSTAYGLYPYYSNYQDIYFNSVSVTVPSPTNGRALYHYYGTFQNLINNSFVNTGGGFAYYVALPSAITQSDYNNIYTTGAILGYWNANTNTLVDLKLASGKDANSVSVDPLYTSATDLHLLSTGLSTLGTPIAGITDDIDGFVRDVVHPTIGADEVPLLQHDAGVTFISRPAAVETEAATFPVKVVIKNFGTDPITSVLVTYILNGGTPVAYTFTPTLPVASLDTVSVTFPANMTVVAGNNNICAFTTLAGDINTFNNQICKNFWGTPLYDAQLAAILPMPEGCGLTMDTVKILIVNQGIMPINGGLTASYKKLSNPAIVTETVSASIPVGGSYTYTFATLVNVAVTVADSAYCIQSWVTLTNDNLPYNNYDTSCVNSLHTPVNPVTTNVSIPYATTASIIATSSTNDPLKWFDVPTGGTSLFTGSPYITPILFLTDTFFVQSSTSSSFSATVGTGTSTQTYPFYTNWGYTRSASIYNASEIGGFGMINEFQWNVATTSTLNIPIKIYLAQTPQTAMPADTWANLISSATLVYDGTKLFDVSGWNAINLSTSFDYNANNLIVLCEANVGGTGLSPIPYFTYTTAGTASHQYFYADGSPPLGTGFLSTSRPNIKLSGNVAGCTSQRLPAIVTVGAQPAFDASAVTIVSPVTGVNLTANDTVKVLVKNYGYSPISNIPVKFKLGNNTIVSEIIATTLASDSVILYAFNQTVNLSSNNQPDTFKLVAWTDLVGDPTHQNDTTKKTVINLPPVFCPSTATSTGDEDLGQVIFAGIHHGNSLPILNSPAANQMYNNYADSVGILATIQPGLTYPISLSVIFANGSYVGLVNAYIDYNRNGIWDLPQELAFTSVYDGISNSTVTGNVTIPYTAVPGLTRMRVVVDESDLAPACGTYTWGETEDYKVRIIPPIPHDGGISKIGTATFVPYTNPNPVNSYFYIRNYGSDSLSHANINYTVNGGIVNTFAWTKIPALLSLEIDSVQLPVNLVFGMNHIVAYTNGIVGDTNYLNDTIHANAFKEFSAKPPYTDNFEVNKYWFPTDTVNSAIATNLWQQGIPLSSSPSLNAVHSPVNAWVTLLSGNYPINNRSILYTPVFDISVMLPDTLKFWQWRQFGAGASGQIQYKDYNGDWIPLGDSTGTNWYNSTATKTWTGIDTTWKLSKFCIKNLVTAGSLGTTVQFRYIFASLANTPTMKGWAIDDFELTLASIPNDGGVTAITSPSATSSVGDIVTVIVTVKNFGTDPLINIPVKYQVGTGAIQTASLAGPLAPGASVSFSFTTQTFQVGTQSYVIRAYTSVVGDLYTQNDTTFKQVTVVPAQNDVGITQIVNPGISVGIGGTSIIKVMIKNFGIQTQTNIPLTFRRGVQPPVDEVWIGSLVSGASVEYTFTAPMTIPSGSSFSLAAYTKLSNDAYVFNDTLVKSVLICNIGTPGAISGLTNVNPNTNNVMYRFASPVTGATSYNWYYSGNDVNMTYDNNNHDTVYLNFGTAATSGTLSVKAWNGTCEGNASIFSISTIPIGIQDVIGSELWLGQNMPNPTTGLTNIEYKLPTSGDVKFDIMTLFGQKVYTFNKFLDAGKYFIDLNVSDLSSGIYYYSIEFKGKRLVKKMVINK